MRERLRVEPSFVTPSCHPSGRDPALGLLQLVQSKNHDLAWSHPGEQPERFPDPLYVGDDGRALPCRVVSDAEPEPEPGLDVIEPGSGLEPSKLVSLKSMRISPDSAAAPRTGSRISR